MIGWKRVWHFIWEDNSVWSWLVNVIIAFILVKYLIYPGFGLLLGTKFPVVAVVSSSMEHNNLGFEEWWGKNKQWYEGNEISKDRFKEFYFVNGFNKGDIMVLKGVKAEDIEIGDVIVYDNKRNNAPIIHRAVNKSEDEGYVIQTKGDNVAFVQDFERNIKEEQIFGKAVLRIPLLGWVKIMFSELVGEVR
jgi:signal peptidase I